MSTDRVRRASARLRSLLILPLFAGWLLWSSLSVPWTMSTADATLTPALSAAQAAVAVDNVLWGLPAGVTIGLAAAALGVVAVLTRIWAVALFSAFLVVPAAWSQIRFLRLRVVDNPDLVDVVAGPGLQRASAALILIAATLIVVAIQAARVRRLEVAAFNEVRAAAGLAPIPSAMETVSSLAFGRAALPSSTVRSGESTVTVSGNNGTR